MPLWFGPRHWGQSSARAVGPRAASQAEATAATEAREDKSSNFKCIIVRDIKQHDKLVVTGFCWHPQESRLRARCRKLLTFSRSTDGIARGDGLAVLATLERPAPG